MAAMSSKKKKKEEVIEEESDDESSTSEEEDSESDVDPQMEIQVEFEARNPDASDFNGIRRLLQQLLLKSHINFSEVTDLILNQSNVGSVIKCIGEEVEEDDHDDHDETYGISTVLNLRHHKAVPCIQDFVKLLISKCSNEKFLSILEDEHQSIGWLISERFINIPPHIAPPLYSSLRSEITKACKKGKPFQLDYLVYMCKSYKIDSCNQSKKKKKKNTESQEQGQNDGIMFINAEDEVLYQKATVTFNYNVSDEGDILVTGKWKEYDNQMVPFRTVMLIPWDQMERIGTEMEQFAL